MSAADELDLAWLSRLLTQRVPGARRANRAELATMRREAGARSATQQLEALASAAGLQTLEWLVDAGADQLPMLAMVPGFGVCLIHADLGRGQWLADNVHGSQRVPRGIAGTVYAPLAARPQVASEGDRSARALFTRLWREQKPAFAAAASASLLANIVALAGSLYSMQVYDRVIPTQGLSTLAVLTIGAFIACVFELIVKSARSAILEASVRRMDLSLSHAIFRRLLDIRADQLPASVGSLSAQLRSHESIRGFISAATLYAAVDAPFGLLFLGVMWMIGGLELAVVPSVFFVVAVVVGLRYRRRIAAHAQTASSAANRKAGVLVETIEGAEAIKAAGTGWAQSAKWNALSRQAIDDELKIRHHSESSAHLAAFLQQASYIAMIGVGAWIASSSGSLTTGALIACSILSGRVLGPIGMLPGLIVQWAHARSALANLERVFELETDNAGIAQPLVPASITGNFQVEDLRFAYAGRPPVVTLPKLAIRAGEKLAILGPVGAGKSTLLKLIAGLYKPQQGRVLVDGLEIQQIAREPLSQHLGYLAQDVRLQAGTLRENLTMGLPEVDEAALLAACRSTGLGQLVAAHPKGLDLEIGEGGSGVSGGQRQLIALTRLVLAKPAVWLLDEPTSSMDEGTERQSLALIGQAMQPGQTLVLVTHKPQLLGLVDRIVVLTHEGIALDGPRDAVLQALAGNDRRAARQAATRAVAAAAAPSPDAMEMAA